MASNGIVRVHRVLPSMQGDAVSHLPSRSRGSRLLSLHVTHPLRVPSPSLSQTSCWIFATLCNSSPWFTYGCYRTSKGVPFHADPTHRQLSSSRCGCYCSSSHPPRTSKKRRPGPAGVRLWERSAADSHCGVAQQPGESCILLVVDSQIAAPP